MRPQRALVACPRPLAACLLVAALIAVATPSPASASRWSDEMSALMIERINAVREARGLPKLRTSPSLNRSSRRYARYQMTRNYFGHLRRIRASRKFRWLGEIVAIHRGRRARVRSTVRRWMRSPGHRAAILSRRFRWAGAGVSRGRFRGPRAVIWVVHFGRR